MLFSKRKAPDADAPKRRSTLNILFNPELGRSFKPVRESTHMFVQLIAMVFASQRLFPKDHPAFRGEEHLSLPDVIRTAWSNLSFTEKGMPQVLFFFAVIACMALMVFAIIVLLMTMLSSPAHAQTGSFSPMGDKDLAQNWIDYLFQGIPVSPDYSVAQDGMVASPDQTVNIQCALMTALGFYSNAILIIAAAVLFYHLASMTVETAHHGQVMGKRANQIWAPIRLVVAVGLLVPIGSSPSACGSAGAGLNSGQFIVIKLAEWGSGLASQTWNTFVETLVDLKFNYMQPRPPDVTKVVAELSILEACRLAWNYQVEKAAAFVPGISETAMVKVNQYTMHDGIHYDYDAPALNQKKVCGSFIIPRPARPPAEDPAMGGNIPRSEIPAALSQAHADTIQDLYGSSLFTQLANNISYFIPDWNASTASNDGLPTTNANFHGAARVYTDKLRTNLARAFRDASSLLNKTVMTEQGWITAGAWMNTVARDQGSIINATKDGLPIVSLPTFGDTTQIATGTFSTITNSVAAALVNYTKWLRSGYEEVSGGGATTGSPCDDRMSPSERRMAQAANNMDDSYVAAPVRTAVGLIEKIAVAEGVWKDTSYTDAACGTEFSLGRQFTSGNPFGELSVYGHAHMRAGFDMLNNMLIAAGVQVAGSFAGMAGAVIGGAVGGGIAFATGGLAAPLVAIGASWGKSIGDELGNVASVLGSIGVAFFGFFALIFFTCGITLAFIIPLLPFIHFFFGALAWILVLLEAIIAAPLVALAHLNPEGDGLPGGMAKQAYFMLFGLLLRPVLLVFGLIASLLIFMLAMLLLNKLYALTVIGTGGMGQGYTTIARLIYSVIYVFLAYACANQSFKIMDEMPSSAMRWMGIDIGHKSLGDGGEIIGQAGPIATGYIAQRGIGGAQSAIGGVNQGISSRMQAREQRQLQRQGEETVTERHNEMLEAMRRPGRNDD